MSSKAPAEKQSDIVVAELFDIDKNYDSSPSNNATNKKDNSNSLKRIPLPHELLTMSEKEKAIDIKSRKFINYRY